MSEEKQLKQAKDVFSALCNMLEERNWHYKKNEEELTISCGAQGDDLPIELYVKVDVKRQLVSLLSGMPFAVPEERRTAIAVAVSKANYGLVDGSFDFNYHNGKIVFRMTSSFRESLIGKEMLEYMIFCSCYTIDEYNDKFLTVVKNDMTLDEILEFIK